MSRFSRYDSDEERLPEGMTRVGYDADTQVYTFQDSDGSLWESAPGCEYGQLTRVSSLPEPEDYEADTSPFLGSGDSYQTPSWRAELMPLLNFGVIIGLSLLLLFWYLHWAASPSESHDTAPSLSCSGTSAAYTVRKGDTCWDLAEARGISLDDVHELNPQIDCEKLPAGSRICLPDALEAT